MKTGRQASATASMTQMSKASSDGAMTSPVARYQARHAQAAEEVEGIAADDVAHRNVALALDRSRDAVATSGMLVPAATMVRPMTRSRESQGAGAVHEAFTRYLEPEHQQPPGRQ